MKSQIDPAVLEALVENSQDQLVYLDRLFNFVWVNRAYAATCRRSPEEFIGHNHFEFYPHPENQAIFERVRDSGEPAVWREKPFVFPDQPERGVTYWDWTLTPLKDDLGRVEGLVFSLHDVTSTVVARERMRESEQRYQSLFESMNEGHALHEILFDQAGRPIDYRFLQVNPAFARLTGLAPHEVIGRTVSEVIPDTRPSWIEAYGRVAATGRSERFEVRAAALGRWLEVFASRPSPGTFAASFADVTDRRQAEAALRSSEESARLRAAELQAVLDAAPAAVFITRDPDSLRMEANHFFLDALRIPPGTNVSKSAPDRERPQGFRAMRNGAEIPPEQLPVQVAARTGREVREYEFDLVYGDGQVRHMFGNATPLKAENGELAGAVGAFVDMTAHKRAQEALRESERLYRAIGESIDYGVWVCGPDGRNRYASESFLKLVGLTQQQCSDFGWGEALHPDDTERTIAAWKECVRTGGTWDIEHRFRGVDGKWHPVLARGVPVRNQAGEIICWAGINLDIGRLKETEEALRESEERFRALADSMPQLAWTARPDGYITWYNRRWYEYTGTTPEQMEGWGWRMVHDPATLPAVLASWNVSLASGTPFEMEFPLRAGDGKFRRFLTRVFPLKDNVGTVLQWFGTNTDVTDLMEAQAALREANRRKDEFLGMLSHELRNPLAPISNSIYILDHADASSEQAHRAKVVIRRQADHLAHLVNDLLDVTRIARGKIELRRQRVDLTDVVRRTADDHRSVIMDRGVKLHVDVPDHRVWVDGDATRLAQLIGNLLQNAAKFTPAGGEVRVSTRPEPEAVELRVRDTGIGIEPELLSRVFEPFVQGERTLARTEGGLGLGLALVRGIAELHGGTVRAESTGKGKGAEFILRLPIGEPELRRDGSHPELRRSGDGRRVLVVDDNRDAAESLADVIAMLGHTVEVAYDGPDAIAKARAGPFDIVLCDIGMPGMTGYEVVRVLRTENHNTMQIFAVSGYAQPEDKRRAVEAGFDGHLAKPADQDELARLLG